MTGAELDTEYDGHWQRTNVDGWAPRCGTWSGEPDLLNCQRPPGHDGEHAAVLGMDPDVNDWTRWQSETLVTTTGAAE